LPACYSRSLELNFNSIGLCMPIIPIAPAVKLDYCEGCEYYRDERHDDWRGKEEHRLTAEVIPRLT
jgi:hypothetical protein